MPVRNIEDKKLRIKLSTLDQDDLSALIEAAREAHASELGEDAIRIVREVLTQDPEHREAATLLREWDGN